MVAEDELYKAKHNIDDDTNKNEDGNGGSYSNDDEGLGDYQQDLLQRYYYQNRTANVLPYGDWIRLFPELDLVHGKYHEVLKMTKASKERCGGGGLKDVRTADVQMTNNNIDDDDETEEGIGGEERKDDDYLDLRNFDRVLEYRNQLKGSIMKKLMMECKR